MISQPMQIIRINKLGKPYVQSTDPSITNNMVENDLWLNTDAGTMKIWNGTGWDEMQFGESAIMDDCITNRMIANDISASKITAGRLVSQDGSFYLDLETGEAELLNLILGGQVEGNIIATSSNGLTRVRLRGKEDSRNITAGLIMEERANTNTETWDNAGQLYFAFNSRQSYCTMQNYEIGSYNSSRPKQGYNAGTSDGLMWRMLSTDWTKAGVATYHGYRLISRTGVSEDFTNVPSVVTAIGNCMTGTAVQCNGIVTCTYKMNEVMQLDFNLKMTTAGSGSSTYGISPTILRTLNSSIPKITPLDGGTLQIFTSAGALSTTYVGATLKAVDGLWRPAYISSGSLTNINESVMAANVTIVGTCYGTYSLEEEEG